MDFASSQTLGNLARAFAGECQAQNRYSFYAEQARSEGLVSLGWEIDRVASNERAHARVFFDLITGGSPAPLANLPVRADYPFKMGDNANNMLFALQGEQEESQHIYPEFARVAAGESLQPAADAFNRIAAVESLHAMFFDKLHTQLKEGSLYRRPQPTLWRCSHCGHTATMSEPWQTCPICGRPRGYVELMLGQQ